MIGFKALGRLAQVRPVPLQLGDPVQTVWPAPADLPMSPFSGEGGGGVARPRPHAALPLIQRDDTEASWFAAPRQPGRLSTAREQL